QPPVVRVEGPVQGEQQHDDPEGQHGTGDDREERAELAALGQGHLEQRVRVVHGSQAAGQLAPLGRAQLAQISLIDHVLVCSQPARRSHARRNLDYVTDELVYAHAGFGARAVDYVAGWDLQRAVHARRVADELPDCCLLLEHRPVYTAGKRTAAGDRPFGDPGAPVIDVDRGGKITWHGPGQLTGYPIIKLRDPVGVVAYVRALEEAMIGVCAEFGLEAIRVEGRSGAWLPASAALPERKVGAIGARVARGVTMHGL